MGARRTSIFTSIELAALIERAEADFMAQCVAVSPDDPATNGNFAMTLGSGIATFGGTSSPFTKVAGAGFGDQPSRDEIERVERRIADSHGVPQFEVATLADPQLVESLTSRGYRLVGFENVLGRSIDPTELAGMADSAAVVVKPADERLELWLDVVVRASLSPETVGVHEHETFGVPELERSELAMRRAGSRPYLAEIDGTPAGGGGLRIAGRIAQLTGAATLPEYRRRSVQTALVQARLIDAVNEGCDLAVVTTQPGSVSQFTMQKMGFDLLYSRAILDKPV
ncbi:GNAT family N-acetyltransferase [Leifsonia sp. 2TAF2]|uniref:GNAT family N-acetyltransferase n=1 Tax=Leifsonia sp. 2TAF2 TaxID=3233009 RepID=UPI003F9BA586